MVIPPIPDGPPDPPAPAIEISRYTPQELVARNAMLVEVASLLATVPPKEAEGKIEAEFLSFYESGLETFRANATVARLRIAVDRLPVAERAEREAAAQLRTAEKALQDALFATSTDQAADESAVATTRLAVASARQSLAELTEETAAIRSALRHLPEKAEEIHRSIQSRMRDECRRASAFRLQVALEAVEKVLDDRDVSKAFDLLALAFQRDSFAKGNLGNLESRTAFLAETGRLRQPTPDPARDTARPPMRTDASVPRPLGDRPEVAVASAASALAARTVLP